jgi:hypothetical protein
LLDLLGHLLRSSRSQRAPILIAEGTAEREQVEEVLDREELLLQAVMVTKDRRPPVSTFMPSFETAARSLKVTPKHASWLNMVEIEIGVLRSQCLDRRIETGRAGARLNMIAARLSPGAISESSSSHLPPREASLVAKSVTFPPPRRPG